MKIVFENGDYFVGKSFGALKTSVLEAVFNTSSVGYQEIISDPSYFGQIVFMTYPLIGNYGINLHDYENAKSHVGAIAVSEIADQHSNYQSVMSLSERLKKSGIPAICDIDTRQITRIIRKNGSMRVLITDNDDLSIESSIDIMKNTPILKNHVAKLSNKKNIKEIDVNSTFFRDSIVEHKDCVKKVVIIDCGVKYGIIRSLLNKSCRVYIAPYNISPKEILNFGFDGVVISNGPGDPEDNVSVIDLIKKIQGKIPMFGICLGHQMIALANGAKTYKMKFGHRGANHPVKNLESGKIEITSQNHSYAVDVNSFSGTDLKLTHINLLDNTPEGVEIKSKNVFSVQYHPESSPGPRDSFYLFEKFVHML
jgi:carbamoyl-phosphate synthase small subunit